jgi:arylsulfatase A-like enzyme
MAQKPNLILITIDALRADHLGFMGYKKDISPNIDNLAKESIVFKNAFSVGPTTPYSFPSILTSTYPLDYQGPREIKKPRVFISEVFKKEGFITAAFHSSPYLSDYFGYDKGWDFFKDIHFSTNSSPGESWFKKIFNKITISILPELFFWMAYLKYRIQGPKKNIRVRASFVNQVVKDFMYFLKGKNKPFFLWVHYMDTHTPPLCYFRDGVCSYGELIGDYVGAAIWAHGNKGALKRFIKNNFEKYLGETLSSYDKAIKYLDEEIGELLNFFKKQDIYQNSVICVASDHGDEFLEHGGLGHNIQLYNEALSVPLLIRIPESNSTRIPGGKIVENKVSLIDLAPTLCDLVGIKKDPTFKGKNLIDGQEGLIFHQSAFSEREGHRLDIERLDQCRVACQSDSWKYILDYGTGKEELYNLREDPGEQNNLSNVNLEILSQMRKKVQEFEEKNPPLSKL